MKLINTVSFLVIFFSACTDSKNNTRPENVPPIGEAEKISFFPVTDFLKGQIAEMKKEGINPLKIIVKDNQQDSLWLKIEELEKEFAPFLSPVIDSTNLSGLFTEKKFLDQTIDAFTFTYDPVKPLPDSFLLQRWDVYIDPHSGTVRRIYMLKRMPDHKIWQLTWLANKSCRIVHISSDAKGNDRIEKEITIKWDF